MDLDNDIDLRDKDLFLGVECLLDIDLECLDFEKDLAGVKVIGGEDKYLVVLCVDGKDLCDKDLCFVEEE